MVDWGEVVGRDEGELGTLRLVVDGLWTHGGRPALVAVGEEGVEIWTYGELAGRVLSLGRGLRGAGVLRRGQNLVWFAEGERSPTGSLQPFKPGVGMLLSYYPVPVVPAFIRGTYEAMPRGKFLRSLEQVTVTFGEPFDSCSFHETARPQEQVVEAVRERVAELGGH